MVVHFEVEIVVLEELIELVGPLETKPINPTTVSVKMDKETGMAAKELLVGYIRGPLY